MISVPHTFHQQDVLYLQFSAHPIMAIQTRTSLNAAHIHSPTVPLEQVHVVQLSGYHIWPGRCPSLSQGKQCMISLQTPSMRT
jgi:hypothetical protein